MRGVRATTTGLVLTVSLAACSSGKRGDNPSSPDTRQKALQYAQCMRNNGVPNFPDPGPDGRFPERSHKEQDDTKFRAATERCIALAPGGEHDKVGDPMFVEQVRAFAQCMRDNGLPDFPDPDADGRLRGPGHEKQNNPTYQAANEKCRDKLPGGGQHG